MCPFSFAFLWLCLRGAVKIVVVLVKKKKIFVEVVILGKAGEYFLDGRIFDCIHEITVALAFARMTDSSAYRVETTSRLAQWKIDNLASCTYRKSDPFKIGKWNWLVLSCFPFLHPWVDSLQ